MLSNIFIKSKSNIEEKCKLKVSNSEPWLIELDCPNLGIKKYKGDDLFDALLLMRKSLEKVGIQVLCNGSRKNVFSSGMSRSMGGGRKAYIIKIGSPVKSDSLVDIFEYAEPNLIANISEQNDYFNEWVNSLRDL